MWEDHVLPAMSNRLFNTSQACVRAQANGPEQASDGVGFRCRDDVSQRLRAILHQHLVGVLARPAVSLCARTLLRLLLVLG